MTNKPLIELRSIDLHVGLSEETPAYTAKIHVDGEHFADVSNRGHGGCDMQYAPRGKESGFHDRLEKLKARIEAFTAVLGRDIDVGDEDDSAL